MTCFRPERAFRDREGGTVRFGGFWSGETGDPLSLPCGRCVGCRMDRARSWSIRIGHEAQLYDSNLFVTFDYAPEHLPASLSLEYRDMQLFLKRLRKAVSGVSVAPDGRKPIRFFLCGEYGEKFKRPHWHVILFNCAMKDREVYYNGTSRSKMMEDLWAKGGCVIGDVTPESAAYVAGYTQNKVYGRGAYEHYEDVVNTTTGEVTSRRPPFVVMSRKPGIGAWWYDKFGGDVFPHDHAIQAGKSYKVPRYYWKKYEEHADWKEVEEVRERRYERAKEHDPLESTPSRLGVREEVARARMKLFMQRDH